MKKSITFLALACLILFAGCETKRGKTVQNIKLGIKTETTASVKYAAFGQKARVEGLDTIAKLFEAASKAEAIHASNHADVLKSFMTEMDEFKPEFKVASTVENLKQTIDGETYEVNEMYPMFLQDAKSKKIKKATIESLTWALETEKKHVAMFKAALEALNSGLKYNLPFEYMVCPVCGNTYDKVTAPETCELCGSSKNLFIDMK
jgi:Rubrerythrin